MFKYDNAKYLLAKQMYLEGKSLTQIQKELNFERHKLSYLLQQDGIDIKLNGQKHEYNETYFNCIDTEQKAYWLGFIYADGNVINYGNYALKICLHYEDLEHVKKFEQVILKSNDTIVSEYMAKLKGKEYPSAKILVNSKTVVEQLIKLGCVPDKSLVLKFPNNTIVPDNLINHFIRGYFDGDGCITYSTGNKTSPLISFLGTKSFLDSLLDIFKNLCTDYGAESLGQKKGQQAWEIKKCKQDTCKEIYEYLYKNATIYLKRKYDRFVEFYGEII